MTILSPGQALGQWTVRAFVAEGGNGEVWSATGADEAQVALKFLKSKNVDSVAYQRFRREIHAVQQLTPSPGILPILEVNVPEALTKAHRAWYVMPFAASLESHLEGATVSAVVDSVASVAETLARVHARGISHRDLKPGNLLWFDDAPQVGDFGLVSLPDQTSIAEPGRVPGSLGYISNEMMVNPETADAAASDVFALAKTLWKLLVPKALFPPQGSLLADGGPSSLSRELTAPNAEGLDRIIEAATRPEASRISMPQLAAELRGWLALPVPADLPDEVMQSIAAARASMAGTLSERDGAAVRTRQFEQAQATLVAQAKPLFDVIRTIDPSGAVVGARAILRELRPLVEQTPALDGRTLGSAYHHGIRITRQRDAYLEEHLVVAFALQTVNDVNGAVAACALLGEERVLQPGYSWMDGPIEAPLGIQFDAAIAQVVAAAMAQLPELMSFFTATALATGERAPLHRWCAADI